MKQTSKKIRWIINPEYPKYKVSALGQVLNLESNKLVSVTTTESGYQVVSLSTKSGKRKSVLLHRLVALTFLKNPKGLPDVHHKDNNRANNVVSNLEWSTKSDNTKRTGIHRTTDIQPIGGVGEIWTDVIGFEGIYKISNMGRICSITRIYAHITKTMNVKAKFHNGRFLSFSRRNGYYVVTLRDVWGKQHKKSVHRLVIESFMGLPDDKTRTECNHINKNRADNRLKNLEWVTPSENMFHAKRKRKRCN